MSLHYAGEQSKIASSGVAKRWLLQRLMELLQHIWIQRLVTTALGKQLEPGSVTWEMLAQLHDTVPLTQRAGQPQAIAGLACEPERKPKQELLLEPGEIPLAASSQVKDPVLPLPSEPNSA